MRIGLAISTLATLFLVSAPAPAQEWGGLYAGGQYSFGFGGDVSYFQDGTLSDGPFALGGDQFGTFVGYNLQAGDFVFGGEVAYATGTVNLNAAPAAGFSDIVDLRARAGVALGSILPYAFVGGSVATFEDPDFGGAVGATGWSYGVGADVMITEQVFLGAAYVVRDLGTEENPLVPGNTAQGDLQSFDLRVGIQF